MQERGKPPSLPNLPQRAHSALDEQLETCRIFLSDRFSTFTAHAEKALFKQANQARNHTEQGEYLASLNQLKRHQGQLRDRTLERLSNCLQHFGEATIMADRSRDATPAGLALVGEQNQDQRLLLQDLASRAEARATMPLFELGHRYAVLAALPILETSRQTFCPAALCDCIRHAMTAMEMPSAHVAIVYRAFDETVLKHANTLYEQLNQRLVDRGILPNLRGFALRRKDPAAAARTREGPALTEESTPEMPSAEAPTPEPAQPAGHHHDAAPAEATQIGTSQQVGTDADLYATLTALLAAKRHAAATPPPRGRRRQTSPESLDAALEALQHKPATITDQDGRPQPRSMQDLRREMLTHLRHADPNGAAPFFTPPQRDAVELMTLLLDRLGEDIHSHSGNFLLSELQAPLLRVALNDEGFFTNHQHPARRWLETVAEASARWGAEPGSDDGAPELMERIRGMNRIINRDFDGDPSVFTGLSDALQQQLAQLARLAEITERRQVEAARGQERLEIAHRRAAHLVTQRMDTHATPSLTCKMLQFAWIDVLTLSLLRDGEDSEEFRHNLAVVEAVSGQRSKRTTDQSERLRQDLEQGLAQVGMQPREAGLLARDATGLADPREAENDEDQVTRTELALKLKQRKPVGVEDIDLLVDVHNAPPQPDEAEHRAAMERIKQLDFGTWFEFDDPESGKPVRRKMAWFSTTTGRCLFVNRRGIRTHDTHLDHLAQALLAGSARIPEPDPKSFVDRAWTRILGTLRGLTGKVPPKEQTA